MKENKDFKRLVIFAIAATMCLGALAMLPSASADSDFLHGNITPLNRGEIPFNPGNMGTLGLSNALVAGANYLKHAQADITEDNAGNGLPVDDPQDGGWDWKLTSPAFTHSMTPSSTNLFGVTAMGLYYAYLETSDPTYLIAMDDVATQMLADPTIDSAQDLIFLMLYDDLKGSPGTWDALAQAKYLAKLASVPGLPLTGGEPYTADAKGLGEYIRDLRGMKQGYKNGIIAWDIGAWAKAAGMLDSIFGGYWTDADAFAKVIHDDSFLLTPGYFDIFTRCQGFDGTYTNTDYYWYTLGITGLIDAFDAANYMQWKIPQLETILMACQYPSGAFSYSYGVNPTDEDWQSTAYAVMTMATWDIATYQQNINDAFCWLASTQDPVSGGWVYGSGNHYPEVGGECTSALYFANGPVTNIDTGEIFCTIQGAIDDVDTVNGHTIEIDDGTYYENVVVDKELTLEAVSSAAFIDGGGSGNVVLIKASNIAILKLKITNGDVGIRTYGGPSTYDNVLIQNTRVYHNNVNGILMVHDTLTNWYLNDVRVFDTYGSGGNGIGMGNSLIVTDMLFNNVRSYNNQGHGFYAGGGVTTGGIAPGLTMDTCRFYDNFWQGIHVENSAFDDFTMTDNCEVRDNTGYGIVFKGTTSLTNSLIEETEIYDNTGGSGLAFACTVNNVDVSNCLFYGNAWEDIDIGSYLSPSSFTDLLIEQSTFNAGSAWRKIHVDASASYSLGNIQIHENNFLGSTAVFNANTVLVDAECNWWNSVNGPTHSSNTYNVGSQGEIVSDNVDFCGWLDAAYPGGVCWGPVENEDTGELFCSIQAAIDDSDTVDTHTIKLASGVFSEGPQIHITKDLTIYGDGCGNTIIKPTANTGSSGDARGWFLVDDATEFNLASVELDGTGFDIYQAIRHKGYGTIQLVCFKEIKYPGYGGVALAAFGSTGSVNTLDCTFEEIGRIGILQWIAGTISGNTYTGKGDGDWLDYFVDTEGGVVTIDDNYMTDCTGVASDGSTSAGILVCTYYVSGADVTITNNDIFDSTTGIAVGYDEFDTSTVVANCNNIVGNDYGASSTAPIIDATCNWWGNCSGPGGEGPGTGDAVNENVTYDPWVGLITVVDAGGPYYNEDAPYTIHFDGSYTTSGCCGEVVTFEWDFGDGDTSTEIDPTHNYPNENGYTATLTITTETTIGSLTHICSKSDTAIVNVHDDPPIVQLEYPRGGEELSGTIVIKWFALDSEDWGSPSIWLYYTADGGDSWVRIAKNLENTIGEGAHKDRGEYSWSAGSLPDGNYMVRIYAYDNAGNLAIDTSDPFAINNHNSGLLVSYVTVSSNYVKNDDSLEIKAGIAQGTHLTAEEITADLSGLGKGTSVPADSFDGLTATWDLTNVVCTPSDGPITITVTAGDKSNTATITADNTLPELTVIKPENALYFFNAKLFATNKPIIIGAITLEATADDSSGVQKTEIYIDDELKETLTGGSEWYMNLRLMGRHTLKIVAYDNAGNTKVHSQTVIIINPFGEK